MATTAPDVNKLLTENERAQARIVELEDQLIEVRETVLKVYRLLQLHRPPDLPAARGLLADMIDKIPLAASGESPNNPQDPVKS